MNDQTAHLDASLDDLEDYSDALAASLDDLDGAVGAAYAAAGAAYAAARAVEDAAEDEGERVPHCSNCNGTVLKEDGAAVVAARVAAYAALDDLAAAYRAYVEALDAARDAALDALERGTA
ncbi:MAG: hypothetical protein O2956_15045 [Gemmatimonadetes bacterium]|nr:hypothetical protein [Gemmatimonadota bacterium]